MPRTTTDEKVIAALKAGQTMVAIARRLTITRQRVAKIRDALKLPTVQDRAAKRHKSIVADLKAGQSIAETARLAGISRQRVAQIRDANNIVAPTSHDRAQERRRIIEPLFQKGWSTDRIVEKLDARGITANGKMINRDRERMGYARPRERIQGQADKRRIHVARWHDQGKSVVWMAEKSLVTPQAVTNDLMRLGLSRSRGAIAKRRQRVAILRRRGKTVSEVAAALDVKRHIVESDITWLNRNP